MLASFFLYKSSATLRPYQYNLKKNRSFYQEQSDVKISALVYTILPSSALNWCWINLLQWYEMYLYQKCMVWWLNLHIIRSNLESLHYNGIKSPIYFLFYLGNASSLYESVHEKILSLPSNFLLYPGHDYQGLNFWKSHLYLKWNHLDKVVKNVFLFRLYCHNSRGRKEPQSTIHKRESRIH